MEKISAQSIRELQQDIALMKHGLAVLMDLEAQKLGKYEYSSSQIKGIKDYKKLINNIKNKLVKGEEWIKP